MGFSQFVPEFFQADSSLPVAFFPKNGHHFAECGQMAISLRYLRKAHRQPDF